MQVGLHCFLSYMQLHDLRFKLSHIGMCRLKVSDPWQKRLLVSA
jgi:hypothetical protein